MIIREYRHEDLPELAKLFYDTVHSINISDYTEDQVDAWATGTVDMEAWDKAFCEHNTFVAMDNGAVVGFGDIDKSGYLDRLYVHCACQRRGIATVLCNVLEASVHAGKITVHASVTAKPFFEKRGYVVLREQMVERNGVLLKNYAMALQRNGRHDVSIRKAERNEFPILVDLWERSVRATHHFLKENDLQEIKRNMPVMYLPGVDLHIAVAGETVVGFVGLSGNMIDMLFVDADCIGRGYGSALLNFAIDMGCDKVDVNEQNESALLFYRSKGFRMTGRDDTDAEGKSYPILHMSL